VFAKQSRSFNNITHYCRLYW